MTVRAHLVAILRDQDTALEMSWAALSIAQAPTPWEKAKGSQITSCSQQHCQYSSGQVADKGSQV